MQEHIIQVNADLCIGCGQCKKDCPASNIDIVDKKSVIKTQNCIKCGHCVAICPKAAVSMSGFEQPPLELAKQPLDAAQLLMALRGRRSIRQFTDKLVATEIIEQIIEAGRWTPTGNNAKSVSFIVLKNDKDCAEALAVCFFRRIIPLAKLVYPAVKDIKIDERFFFKGAPIAIMVVSSDTVSASLAASNMALMAESCGLGVLYSGFFSMAANMSSSLRKALGLNLKEKTVTTLVLGYSAVTYSRTTQKEPAVVKQR